MIPIVKLMYLITRALAAFLSYVVYVKCLNQSVTTYCFKTKNFDTIDKENVSYYIH